MEGEVGAVDVPAFCGDGEFGGGRRRRRRRRRRGGGFGRGGFRRGGFGLVGDLGGVSRVPDVDPPDVVRVQPLPLLPVPSRTLPLVEEVQEAEEPGRVEEG